MSVDSVTTNQVQAFKNLLTEVNKIPNVTISLTAENDRQRDSLAFVVDELYRQFNNSHWQLILQDFVQKVNEWNTAPQTSPTAEISKFIKHLFEARVVSLLEDNQMTEEQKNTLRHIRELYTISIDAILENTPFGKPVTLAGIPTSFLPAWYQNKLYLKI
jgi:hypothetical protein